MNQTFTLNLANMETKCIWIHSKNPKGSWYPKASVDWRKVI